MRKFTLSLKREPLFSDQADIFCGAEWLQTLKTQGLGERMTANRLYRAKQWGGWASCLAARPSFAP